MNFKAGDMVRFKSERKGGSQHRMGGRLVEHNDRTGMCTIVPLTHNSSDSVKVHESKVSLWKSKTQQWAHNDAKHKQDNEAKAKAGRDMGRC